jgi:hypothetical protein
MHRLLASLGKYVNRIRFGRGRCRDCASNNSADHRVVDGWEAALFMRDLKKLIENPLRLLSVR